MTGSACSRRAAYAIASSDALSSHCRSSIATRMRSPSLQRPERGEHGERDRLGLRRSVRRVGPVERDVQRAHLRRRDRSELLARDRVEQVDQPGERQPALVLAGPGDEHAAAVLAGPRDAALPQAGLADARITLEHQRAGVGAVSP